MYTDGYYVPYNDTFRKQVFLKDTSAFKVALRTFDPLASHNIQDMRLRSLPLTKDEIIIASETLNKTRLAKSKLETSNTNLRNMKNNFLLAVESIPTERYKDIPSHVANVYNKLAGTD